MGVVQSVLGSLISPLLVQRPFWAVKLKNDKFLTELDTVFDVRAGERRLFDWSHDLIDTGDINEVKELWLICPPTPTHPLGQTRKLDITEPGTAFQFKTATVDAIGAWGRTMECLVIGRVDNKETGICTCYIWDTRYQDLVRQTRVVDGKEEECDTYRTSIYAFGTWRESLAPIGRLSEAVMGLRLG